MIHANQQDALLRGPDPKSVHQRSQAGKTFTYLAQHAVRTELIRVFGFDGWSGQVVESELMEKSKNDEGRWMVAYRVRYALTVRWQPADHTMVTGMTVDGTSTWVEDAIASAFGSSLVDALDQALKSAASDAMKRCAMNLGSRFGLSLYFDGYIGDVVRVTPQSSPSSTDAVAASLASAGEDTGETGTTPPRGAQSLDTPEAVAAAIDNLRKPAGVGPEQGDDPEWSLG